MKRLYVYVVQAVRPHSAGLDIRSQMGWAFAATGDEIAERAWEKARSAFPLGQGFEAHHVMIATLDDNTVAELVRLKIEGVAK